jgi:hypothetical protein
LIDERTTLRDALRAPQRERRIVIREHFRSA